MTDQSPQKSDSSDKDFPTLINPNTSNNEGQVLKNLDLRASFSKKQDTSGSDPKVPTTSLQNLNTDRESTAHFLKSGSIGDNLILSHPTLANSSPHPNNMTESSPFSDMRNILHKVSCESLNLDGRTPEAQANTIKRFSGPAMISTQSDDSKRENSMNVDFEKLRSEIKESVSIDHKSKEESGASFLTDIMMNRSKTSDESKKSGTSRRRLLSASKPPTIGLTFDAFVDKMKGSEVTSLASNYPSYKIDKRLIFLGKEVDLPWHVFSYFGPFRKLWNLFIIAVITYEIFWYTVFVAFEFGTAWPHGSIAFEIFSILIFFIDILLNFRTTYFNDNNEEIIDSKMMSQNYMKTFFFKIDVITTLPIPEAMLIVPVSSSLRWHVYSLVILIRMLRVFKISKYLENRTLGVFMKLVRIFVTFFIVVHWVSCIWYLVIKAEYSEELPLGEVYFPNNLRMIAAGDDDLVAFYTTMSTVKVYSYTLLSVFMLVVGSDMAPATNVQIWFSVMIGLFGAVTIAYIFALVTLHINRANKESSHYQQQLEDLKHKLHANKIPHNLKVKVMEYFYYSWRKHSVLKKMNDFSELSIPLQRDIALYQHQEMLSKVPLFSELDPLEILSIIQNLKTAIYMPGDKIVREGEKGTEMYFIQEGVVEMLLKKPIFDKIDSISGKSSKYRCDRILLEKGCYFGEVALISNSKRTFDVNAFEFCILYTFSRSDYDDLKTQFRDIGPRLRSGLKHYKNTHMGMLIQILQRLEIFKGFSIQELRRICDEYLEELFVDPDRVLLDPKEKTNALYIILDGTVNCYVDNEKTRNYLNYLKKANTQDNGRNFTVVGVDEGEIGCLDDDILNLEKDKFSMEDQKNKLDRHSISTYGDYFGTLDFEVNEIKCDKFYVSDTGCQIGAITQEALKNHMAVEDPVLYEKLKNNIIRCSNRRLMIAIQEESESSFTTKNSAFIKARLSRRQSCISDFGKKSVIFKTTSLGKKDDVQSLREELQQLDEAMNSFKSLIYETTLRLNKVPPNQSLSLRPDDPGSVTNKSKTINHFFPTSKNVLPLPTRRYSSYLSLHLPQLDEVDKLDESKIPNDNDDSIGKGKKP